ncbi:hypothetical protein M8J77_005982 [Diaphorina citri]|nr:hypothetical protein M8J77_005982 [Diaphorina citri]
MLTRAAIALNKQTRTRPSINPTPSNNSSINPTPPKRTTTPKTNLGQNLHKPCTPDIVTPKVNSKNAIKKPKKTVTKTVKCTKNTKTNDDDILSLKKSNAELLATIDELKNELLKVKAQLSQSSCAPNNDVRSHSDTITLTDVPTHPPAHQSSPITSAAPESSRVSTQVSQVSKSLAAKHAHPETSNFVNILDVPKVPEVRSRRRKLILITDSMGRGISELLLSLLPNMDVSAFVYPNATFDQCLNSVEPLCSSLTKNDFVFILCGTNNTTSLAPNSCPRLDLNKIKRLQMKTNVIVSSILYRHDMYAYQNTNIYYTNQYLQHKCRTLNVYYYHSND